MRKATATVRRYLRFAFVSLVAALLVALVTAPSVTVVSAAPMTYTVNRTADDQTDAACNSLPTGCTLRQAVNASNGNDPGVGNANAITFDAAVFGVAQTINLTAANGVLTLSRPVTIAGPGANLLAIDAGCMNCQPGSVAVQPMPVGGTKHFAIPGAGTYMLSGMTLQHGRAGAGGSLAGGAVDVDPPGGTTTTVNLVSITLRENASMYNGGAIVTGNGPTGGTVILTVQNSTLAGNSAAFGGAIFNSSPNGTVNVVDSTITGSVAGSGGGMYEFYGTLNIVSSTLVGNSAGTGGGIFNDDETLYIANSTISGNSATYDGGGIFLNGNGLTDVVNSTFAGNAAIRSGGGMYAVGRLNVTNTLVVDNTALAGADVYNGLNPGSKNNRTGSFTFADPDPKTPQDHGGQTRTLALPSGSPAVGAGDAATCAVASPTGAGGKDQRGQIRPGIPGLACDIGAYEYQPVTPTVTGTYTVGTAGQSVQLTGTGFQANTAITLDGVTLPASAVTNLAPDGTALTVVLPAHAPGMVALTVTNPGASIPARTIIAYQTPAVQPPPLPSHPNASPAPDPPQPQPGMGTHAAGGMSGGGVILPQPARH